MQERLQKIISRAGVASRRRAEDLIVAGQVRVNGKLVTELGAKADPEQDSIRVAGRVLRMPERKIVLALHKPDACVSTLDDPGGRPTLRDFLHGVSGRVFPVGRLEYHATGLLLLTNDGELAARLFRALGRGLRQTYRVKVKNPLTAADLEKIARRAGPIRASRPGANPWYEVRLAGARQDRLRKMIGELGHPVEKLKRVAIGPIELGELKTGSWRAVSEPEIRSLEVAMKRLESGARPEDEKPRRRKPRRKRAAGKAKTE